MNLLRILLRLLLVFRFYIGIILLALLGWFIAKKLGYIKGSNKSKSLPVSAPCGRLSSRLAEAIMLACSAGIFIAFSLLIELPNFFTTAADDVIRIYTIFIAALCAIALLGVITVLLWRASTGFVIVTIACFVIFLTGTRSIDPVALSGIKPVSERDVKYTFTVNDGLVGVDLWINDVYLGKTPVETTLQEFVKKVPYWPEPPEGINDIVSKETLSYQYNDGWSSTERARWISFKIPEIPGGDSLGQRTYYARIQLGDAIGYGYSPNSGQGLSSSGRGDKRIYSGDCRFEVFFPLREQRIETLLSIARLKNYEVGDEWFDAMASFGDDGWKALKKAAYLEWLSTTKQYYATYLEPVPSEPGMLRVMDKWVSRYYGLDKVKNENDAWAAFQKVCAEADKRKYYSGTGLAGRAVEMLVPKLNKEQFVNWALGRVRSYAFHSFAWDAFVNRNRFETKFDENDYQHRDVRASDYIAAHAIFEMDKFLDKQNNISYNIIEREITKAILVWQGPVNHASFLLAAALDGPDLVPYFKKCYIASKRGDRRFKNSFSSSGFSNINLWLYLLAQLTNPEAEDFKVEYISDLTDMTLKLAREDHSFAFNRLDYLSLDTDKGSESLGAQLWSQYKQLIESGQDKMGYGNLYKLWRYLLIIEPVMSAQTYIECWRENIDQNRNFRDTIDILDVLPVEKRRVVYEGLIEEVRLRPENLIRPGILKGRNSTNEPDASEANYVLQKLERELAQLDDKEFADYFIQENTRYSAIPGHMLKWLEQMRPGHIAAEVMAQSEDFQLRVNAVRLLKAFPIPERVAIIEKLAKDSDSTVRQTAESALSELDNLGQIPLNLLASEIGDKLQEQINKSATVYIRAYTNLSEDTSVFKLIEVEIKVIRELSGIDKTGLPEYKIKGVEVPQMDSASFPADTVFLIDLVDQKNRQVAEALGNTIYIMEGNKSTRNISAKSQVKMVTLIDAQGNPIPNASVEFILTGRMGKGTIELSGHNSDEYGKIVSIETNGSYYVNAIRVTHPDYGTVNIEFRMRSTDRDIRVPMFELDSLGESRAVYGVVLDSDNNPIEGAKVQIVGVLGSFGSIAPVSTNDALAFTDEHGRFNIYPKGQNITEPPIFTDYELRIDAPKDFELPPFTGLYKNGEESKIILKQNGYFHTFTFEEIDGTITDEKILSRIRLLVTQNDGNRLELRGDFLTEGGYVPLGKYTPYMSDSISFETFEITAESPRNIVFHEKPGKTFRGRVVHGVTGEPVAGAFVFLIDAIASNNMAKITAEQWEILHQQPYGSFLNDVSIEIIKPMYSVNSLLRTDAQGCFEVQLRARNFYTFVAFEENFLPYKHRINSGDIPNKEIIEMQELRLFPAAKVKLGFEEFENIPEVMPIPVIDINNSPPWADIFEDTGRFEFSSWHSFRNPTLLNVPANVTFKLSLKPTHFGRESWSSITVIPKDIYLEQGQTFDLGLVKLNEAIPVIVKVVNSKDESVEGISITKYQYEDNVKYGIGQTNPDGILNTSLNSNSKGELWARFGRDDIAAKVTFEIGGQEDSGREFKLVIPEGNN